MEKHTTRKERKERQMKQFIRQFITLLQPQRTAVLKILLGLIVYEALKIIPSVLFKEIIDHLLGGL